MDTTLTLLTLLIGIATTVLVSKHYYKKSVEKKLTPYLVYSSALFRFADKSIKSKLTVSYEGKEIDNLHELRFIIANDGEKPISNPIKPLTLSIHSGEVINAVIEKIHPDGRRVNIETCGNIITFDFDLLNRNENFLVYVLINGKIQDKDYEFTMVEEELPPKLKIKNVRFDQMVHTLSKNKAITTNEIGFVIFVATGFIWVWSTTFLFAAIALLTTPWTEVTNPYFQQMLAYIGITSKHEYYETLNSGLLRSALSITLFFVSCLFLKGALGFSKDLYLWHAKLKKILV